MYRLIAFGTTNLEYYNQVDSMGSGATPTQYQALPEGGGLDLFGSQQKHPGVVEYSKSLRLQAATPTALTELYFGLLQLRGKREKLYRRTVGSNLTHWKWARLVEVSAKREYEQAKYQVIQDVELRFESADPYWHGTASGWTFDSGYLFDDGLYFDDSGFYALTNPTETVTVTLGSAADIGRAPTRAVALIVYAGDADMTALTIARTNGETLVFNGTITAGSALVIDSGLMKVTMGGVNAYNDLTFTAVADLAAWFALLPGDNDIVITHTGGGTGKGIAFAYDESWY